ncbi:hypothetical protein XELAEV_18032223mg [Xenopus laevis]|uniref:Uncharacterized protein n=1 Tax=Xenopus laevis TaxID=8355 RepID=A0A974CP50_XENLA|nr:hypothetical protein XELAEV_18032223mg [Xenopus laevis]
MLAFSLLYILLSLDIFLYLGILAFPLNPPQSLDQKTEVWFIFKVRQKSKPSACMSSGANCRMQTGTSTKNY